MFVLLGDHVQKISHVSETSLKSPATFDEEDYEYGRINDTKMHCPASPHLVQNVLEYIKLNPICHALACVNSVILATSRIVSINFGFQYS